MKQIRTINLKSKIELREGDDGIKRLIGFIPFNIPSDNLKFKEIITETAFNKTLADNSDVKALVSHDTTKVLGSTRNGTLKLTKQDNGLLCEVDLPETSFANDAYEVIKRGDVDTMSFGFVDIKSDRDYKTDTVYLREVRLYEVSFAVAFPAYEATKSIVRNADFILEKRKIDLETLSETLAKETLNDDDYIIIEREINNLQSLIPAKPVEVKQETIEPVPTNSSTELETTLKAILEVIRK